MLVHDVNMFYELLEELKVKCEKQFRVAQWSDLTLGKINGRHANWKNVRKGLYLFLDNQERRSDSKNHRIVRIGTHAIQSLDAKSTLWGRLKQHKGVDKNNGGNHRSSIFRLLIGEALSKRDLIGPPSWGIGSSASKAIRRREIDHESEVSKYIRELPFLVIKIDSKNDRKFLESNLIGLLSNMNRTAFNPPCPDEPSENWLGHYSCRPLIKNSGLWNIQNVQRAYDPKTIEIFNHYLGGM